MLSRNKNLLWAAFVIIAFLGGVAFGVYYQAEISVWARSLLVSRELPAAVATPAPTAAEVESVLQLAALEGPLPLIYSETLEEEKIQEYLRQGAVVLPLGTNFGQPGNVVVTAHSSGPESFGLYRSAFAKLSEIKPGDEFMIRTSGGVYTYRAYDSEIVWPHEVDKLPNDERSTVTLVTCWPLFTNFKRLLVHGELVKTEPPSVAAGAVL